MIISYIRNLMSKFKNNQQRSMLSEITIRRCSVVLAMIYTCLIL